MVRVRPAQGMEERHDPAKEPVGGIGIMYLQYVQRFGYYHTYISDLLFVVILIKLPK